MDTRNFPIASFGSVLGTGGFILASRPFVPSLVLPMTLLLLVMFSIFSALLLARIILHPAVVRNELLHPLPGSFYALQPISAVILAILCWNLFPVAIVMGLLVYGSVLILALAVYLPYHYFSNINIEFSQLHGGWFITPVATILVTNAVLLSPVNQATMIVALLFFGIGAMLFLLILGVLFFRLISHTLPPVELAPTNYIILAPIGILIVDILQISRVAGTILGANLLPVGILSGVILWGFGLWAIGVNLLLLARYLRLGFRFHIGWWSYVFPTAAFDLGTISLSEYLALFKPVSLILYIGLIAVFLIVVAGSIRGVLKPGVKAQHHGDR